MRVSKYLLLLVAAALIGCTYQYKPKDGVEPALISTVGVLTGNLVHAEEGYSVTVSSINGATLSMIPAKINSDYPKEVPFIPGPTEVSIFVTWPKGSMGKHMDIPFLAKPGESYHFVFSNEGAKHTISLLDSHNQAVQAVTFNLKTVQTIRLIR